MEDWYTLQEAADFLKIEISTLRRWRAQGKVVSSRLGHNTVRIAESELNRFLRDSTVNGQLNTLPVD